MEISTRGLLNGATEVEWEGVTYKFRQLTEDRLDQLATHLEQKAALKVEAMAAYLPAASVEAYRRQFLELNAADHWRPGGAGYLIAMSEPAASKYQLWLAMLTDQPDVPFETAAAIWDAEWAAEVHRKLAAMQVEENAAGNSSGGSSGPGGPSTPGSPSPPAASSPGTSPA